MIVNSINFWIFFLILLIPYLWVFRKNVQGQNLWLLLGSLFFYGFVDWKMVLLMLVAIVVFYALGLKIDQLCQEKKEKQASGWTNLGVCLGVGLLIYFKYLNFFIEQFADLLQAVGFKGNIGTLNIVMPLGISFFTFKLMGYVIEVHREHLRATRDMVKFGVFISFFPTIMSGPIDNPVQFLPQLD